MDNKFLNIVICILMFIIGFQYAGNQRLQDKYWKQYEQSLHEKQRYAVEIDSLQREVITLKYKLTDPSNPWIK